MSLGIPRSEGWNAANCWSFESIPEAWDPRPSILWQIRHRTRLWKSSRFSLLLSTIHDHHSKSCCLFSGSRKWGMRQGRWKNDDLIIPMNLMCYLSYFEWHNMLGRKSILNLYFMLLSSSHCWQNVKYYVERIMCCFKSHTRVKGETQNPFFMLIARAVKCSTPDFWL